MEGSDILLECSATGIWETAVWTREGQVIGRGSRLKLSGVSTTDSGLYTCTVSGCGGSAEVACQVRTTTCNLADSAKMNKIATFLDERKNKIFFLILMKAGKGRGMNLFQDLK